MNPTLERPNSDGALYETKKLLKASMEEADNLRGQLEGAKAYQRKLKRYIDILRVQLENDGINPWGIEEE